MIKDSNDDGGRDDNKDKIKDYGFVASYAGRVGLTHILPDPLWKQDGYN